MIITLVPSNTLPMCLILINTDLCITEVLHSRQILSKCCQCCLCGVIVAFIFGIAHDGLGQLIPYKHQYISTWGFNTHWSVYQYLGIQYSLISLLLPGDSILTDQSIITWGFNTHWSVYQYLGIQYSLISLSVPGDSKLTDQSIITWGFNTHWSVYHYLGIQYSLIGLSLPLGINTHWLVYHYLHGITIHTTHSVSLPTWNHYSDKSIPKGRPITSWQLSWWSTALSLALFQATESSLVSKYWYHGK